MPIIGKDELNDIQVDEHFNLNEFACNCQEFCGGFVVYSPKLVRGLVNLRRKLSILYSHGYIENPRVDVNCACRCFMYNNDIGGVAGSEHLFIGDLGAADIGTRISGLAPLEVGLLAFGQPVEDIRKKYPKVGDGVDFLASRIDEFERFGVYGTALDVRGYHKKRNFIHLGIATKFAEKASGAGGWNLIALPSRWGDWPELADFYRKHPEKY